LSAVRGTIFAGGIALVAGALAFLGVFSYLAASFNYPDVLDGNASDVLPALLATGSAGRTAWAFYSILPLVFIPGAVGAIEALRDRAAGPMRVGMLFAVVATMSMVLGLMRWPRLARVWTGAGESERLVLAATFDGLNRYLGNFVGEFLGELGLSLFFALSGVGLLRRASCWMDWWGIATGALGLLGMWRNVTPAVDLVADVNNYLLPAWMIGFGVWLVLASRKAT
jgi:hypothetical protein